MRWRGHRRVLTGEVNHYPQSCLAQRLLSLTYTQPWVKTSVYFRFRSLLEPAFALQDGLPTVSSLYFFTCSPVLSLISFVFNMSPSDPSFTLLPRSPSKAQIKSRHFPPPECLMAFRSTRAPSSLSELLGLSV